VYARPDSKVDLSEAYRQVKQADPDSDWFLHASKRLLINDSTVNPDMKPTNLSLEQMIEILQNSNQ
jgi:hypothetical protein